MTLRQMQLRRDTSVNWAVVNPVLLSGEPGWDTDLKILKIGDGVTPWSDLDAISDGDDGESPAAGFHVHTQNSPSALWTIVHELPYNPNVTVVDSAGTVVIGEVRYISNTQIEISFSGAFSGKAYLS